MYHSLWHLLVPVTGLEPVRFLRRGILSPLCLPIPPFAVPDECPRLRKAFVPRRPLHTLMLCFICHRQRRATRPFAVPDPLLALKGRVDGRPLHTLRLCFICPRQRKGSRPNRRSTHVITILAFRQEDILGVFAIYASKQEKKS